MALQGNIADVGSPYSARLGSGESLWGDDPSTAARGTDEDDNAADAVSSMVVLVQFPLYVAV